MPRVAVLGASSSPVVGIEYERHPEWSALAALPAYDIVLLDLPAVRAGEALRSLRMDKRYRFSLIYCCQEQDASCKALSDGAPPADLSALVPLWLDLTP